MSVFYAVGRGLALAAAVLGVSALGQYEVKSGCGVPPVASAQAQPNIFSEQQEQWLGEAMADSLEGELTPIRDPSLSAHLQQIADRLVATLPPTQIKFRVMLIDSSEVNGLSIAGGHIYLTRKLAAAARSDDELAGVIGHEIGHIASHQFAFETTRDLRRLLNVTSVGDRADVYAKYQALMDARLHDKHPAAGDTDEKQDEADRIGIYAVAVAGYRPAATPELWDRVFFVDGKTRGKIADFFQITKPTEKRLRLMRALASAIPPGCGGTLQADTREFAAWHEAVVANQSGKEQARAVAIAETVLTPAMRMELERLRFSPDGKWILAQDESSIFVLSRSPLKFRFRVDADGALPANFSPDSSSVTFSTPGLHTEQWDLETGKLRAAHELLSRERCYESKLAPDGRTLLCVGLNLEGGELSLTLLDTETGQIAWQNKNWAEASFGLALRYLFSSANGRGDEALYSAYAPDNNVLLLGSGMRKIAFDLRSRTPIKVGGGLQAATSGGYAFIGTDKVAMANEENYKSSWLVSFPDGKRLRTLEMAAFPVQTLTNTGANLHVLVHGEKDFDAGLADLGASKLIAAVRTHPMDEYDGTMVGESEGGGVAVMRLGETDVKKQEAIRLPVSPLSSLRAVAMSPDGKYLAASSWYRGGLWDAETGKQMAVLKGFSDAGWTVDDTVYIEIAKRMGTERHIMEISMKNRKGTDLTYKMSDELRMRYGRLTEWTQDGKKKSWTLTMHNPADNNVVWTKGFRDAHMGYSASYGDRDLLFSFGLKSNTAKDAMKADSKLAEEAAAVKDKDAGRLLQVIDGRTGVDDGSLIVEVPANYAGLDGVNRAGDSLYVTGADDRTSVYSLASGKEVRKLFGIVMALDAETGRVCTANRVGEAVVYDANGTEIAHFQEHVPIRYAVFRQKAHVLTVLTADQKVRSLVIDGEASTVKQASAGR